jgi:hypothetical protein
LKHLEEQTLALSGAATAEFMRAVLEKGSLFRFRARGRSMTPFIRDGDIITIAPLESRQPRLGEVVAFSRASDQRPALVVHRVVGRDERGYTVQGDGIFCEAETVPSESVLGRLSKVERNGCSVRLGLEPERRLIAWLSRTRLLWKLVWPVWNAARKALKRAQRPISHLLHDCRETD